MRTRETKDVSFSRAVRKSKIGYTALIGSALFSFASTEKLPTASSWWAAETNFHETLMQNKRAAVRENETVFAVRSKKSFFLMSTDGIGSFMCWMKYSYVWASEEQAA